MYGSKNVHIMSSYRPNFRYLKDEEDIPLGLIYSMFVRCWPTGFKTTIIERNEKFLCPMFTCEGEYTCPENQIMLLMY